MSLPREPPAARTHEPSERAHPGLTPVRVRFPPCLVAAVSASEAAEIAGALKLEGNEHFKAARNTEALESYESGVKACKGHEQDEAVKPLLASLHLNHAAACVRLELWPLAAASASSAMECGANVVKSRFRRGVARLRQGQLDGAKEDLTAVCRADPKDRAARTELAACAAALAERRSEEKARMANLFTGSSLYREEELRREREAAAEAERAERKAAEERREEEQMREEWRDECRRLREEAGEAEAMETEAEEDAKAEAAEGEGGGEGGGEGEGEGEGGSDPEEAGAPISFAAFKKRRGEEKEARRKEEEEAEKRAKEFEAEARRRARTERVVVEDDEELTGVVRGYKQRADGTKTSYFDREVDAATKAMLDAQKAPKRIEHGAAGAAEEERRRASAWNTGGTWEEKDVSNWVIDNLKPRLKKARAVLEPQEMVDMLSRMHTDDHDHEGTLSQLSAIAVEMMRATAVVTKVAKLEGTASVTSSRGAVKHGFDLAIDLDFEVTLAHPPKPEEADGAGSADAAPFTSSMPMPPPLPNAKPVVKKGKLKYTDVTPDGSGEARFELAHSWNTAPSADYQRRFGAALDGLKADVVRAFADFVAEYRREQTI